jgi:alginate O-acetyltransferase complex protein AlgI
MLFNSFEFLFVFAPITFIGIFLLATYLSRQYAIYWLIGASIFFYGWWNPPYVALILSSIIFNYFIFKRLITSNCNSKLLLFLGVSGNLAAIAYFKYALFISENINSAFNTGWTIGTIILPLAISFFTFQQIALLVDAWRGNVRDIPFSRYALFILFFPQLIAGPIVRSTEIVHQFDKKTVFTANSKNISVGISIFIIGLFKKVVIADSMALFANPVFSAASNGIDLTIWEAWGGALAYTFQLYFDFSGYSDMAIGLAKIIGIRLPINFFSPYKATSIRDFWRRWHITLSRFLRDYLYIPLGGNHNGKTYQYRNLLFTMALGGLWHGASWTFVLWGCIHGLFLIINNLWLSITTNNWAIIRKNTIYQWSCRFLTFFAVVNSWVIFRADNLNAAYSMYRAMFGINGISIPDELQTKAPWLEKTGVKFDGMFHNATGDWVVGITWIAILLYVIWFLPNTMELMRRYLYPREGLLLHKTKQRHKAVVWRPSVYWAIVISIGSALSILLIAFGAPSDFLYYQF